MSPAKWLESKGFVRQDETSETWERGHIWVTSGPRQWTARIATDSRSQVQASTPRAALHALMERCTDLSVQSRREADNYVSASVFVGGLIR